MKALILVNVQNDFLTGPLAVAGSETLVPLVNQLQGSFKLVVATQDWHPANHRAFVTSHPDRQPGETVTLRKSAYRLQPVHCVQHTRGAELAGSLMLNRVNKVVRLGTDPDLDSRSAFFDGDHHHSTGLLDYLREKRVTELYVAGVPMESAVRWTVLDAVSLGFKCTVIEDACRGAPRSPEDWKLLLDELQAAGAGLTSSAIVLKMVG